MRIASPDCLYRDLAIDLAIVPFLQARSGLTHLRKQPFQEMLNQLISAFSNAPKHVLSPLDIDNLMPQSDKALLTPQQKKRLRIYAEVLAHLHNLQQHKQSKQITDGMLTSNSVASQEAFIPLTWAGIDALHQLTIAAEKNRRFIYLGRFDRGTDRVGFMIGEPTETNVYGFMQFMKAIRHLLQTEKTQPTETIINTLCQIIGFCQAQVDAGTALQDGIGIQQLSLFSQLILTMAKRFASTNKDCAITIIQNFLDTLITPRIAEIENKSIIYDDIEDYLEELSLLYTELANFLFSNELNLEPLNDLIKAIAIHIDTAEELKERLEPYTTPVHLEEILAHYAKRAPGHELLVRTARTQDPLAFNTRPVVVNAR